MSLKTTCGGCRLLKANSDGNPITKSGEEVGLCQLTRPEVKERIQKKLEKGGQVDEDTCPKCQHDVGDHVAKDDDAMTWPPQPVGVQNQAQETWWKVACEFDVPRYSSFRHTLYFKPRRAGHPTALVPTNKHMSCSVRTGIMQAK
eukprot:TRINITY_DN42_c0_g1_i2.p1 TRINITY_DN42_c0_g1~~TRINITY_DN42_c0_g1_i2.p1  ORF type:complete len:145 (+),score=18.86 TRINITY_DN42_c0_g1_i2:1169-1603(+)